MVVLGIDIGLRVSGYVVCAITGRQVTLIQEGEVGTKNFHSLPKRLLYIYERFVKVIEDNRPQLVILEKLYSHYRHPTTVVLLGQARGVVVFLTAKYGLDFFECSSTRARKSFLGRGSGTSSQVKKMAENILGRPMISPHTADAYSLVVTFSHMQKYKRLKGQWAQSS